MTNDQKMHEAKRMITISLSPKEADKYTRALEAAHQLTPEYADDLCSLQSKIYAAANEYIKEKTIDLRAWALLESSK